MHEVSEIPWAENGKVRQPCCTVAGGDLGQRHFVNRSVSSIIRSVKRVFAEQSRMNGYQYLVQRNRLMCRLEDELKKIEHLAQGERLAATKRLEAQFDVQLRELYAKVAAEYPGERKIKARPLSDPR